MSWLCGSGSLVIQDRCKLALLPAQNLLPAVNATGDWSEAPDSARSCARRNRCGCLEWRTVTLSAATDSDSVSGYLKGGARHDEDNGWADSSTLRFPVLNARCLRQCTGPSGRT